MFEEDEADDGGNNLPYRSDHSATTCCTGTNLGDPINLLIEDESSCLLKPHIWLHYPRYEVDPNTCPHSTPMAGWISMRTTPNVDYSPAKLMMDSENKQVTYIIWYIVLIACKRRSKRERAEVALTCS